jgi:hypothetical protein
MASKPPATPSQPCKVHALQGFFMPAIYALPSCQPASPAPQSVQVYTEKKNRLAPLGSSQLLPAILLPYSACCKVKGLHAVPYSHKSKSAGSLHLP